MKKNINNNVVMGTQKSIVVEKYPEVAENCRIGERSDCLDTQCNFQHSIITQLISMKYVDK